METRLSRLRLSLLSQGSTRRKGGTKRAFGEMEDNLLELQQPGNRNILPLSHRSLRKKLAN
jgi:hypothetical protein